jgi:hypothetical protein
MGGRSFTILALLALLMLACQPAATPPVQHVPAPQAQDTDDQAVPEPQPQAPAPSPIARVVNADVAKLFERSESIKGYSFTLAELPKKSGENVYWVRGTKGKVKLATLRQMDGWSADYVFIDFGAQNAYAYCIELQGCKKEGRKGGVAFAEYAVPLPPSWIDEAQYGDKGRALQYNDRPVTGVTWDEDGRYYEAYVDNYYGMPQRVAIGSDPGMSTIVGGYEYQGMAFSVTDADVTPPY